jgi:cytoskeletal protein CcmA (bactofilin family)
MFSADVKLARVPLRDDMFPVPRKAPPTRGRDVYGEIRINGRVKGTLNARHVFVGKTGEITGNVYAESVSVYGRIEGGICARSTRLFSKCQVRGLVLYNTLSIENGAFFEGRSVCSGDLVERLQSLDTFAANLRLEKSHGASRSQLTSAE